MGDLPPLQAELKLQRKELEEEAEVLKALMAMWEQVQVMVSNLEHLLDEEEMKQLEAKISRDKGYIGPLFARISEARRDVKKMAQIIGFPT